MAIFSDLSSKAYRGSKVIIQENHKPQTVEEIAHQLAGAGVFTKADALKAFLQVHLRKAASYW